MNKFILIISLLLYFISNNVIAQENLLGKSKEDIVNNVLKDYKYSINKTLGTIVENIEGVGMQVYSFDTLNNCNKILIVPKEFKINGTSVKQFLWSNCNKNYTILGPDKWKTICRGNYVYIYETTDPDYEVSFVWTY